MKIAIYGRMLNKVFADNIITFLNLLAKNKAKVSITSEFYEQLKQHNKDCRGFDVFDPEKVDVDLVISFGGDGTLLDTVSIVKDSGVPVLGINTGRLGFLASNPIESLEELVDQITKGSFSLDKRTLLELQTENNLFGKLNFALNDFVIHKKETSSMITIHTFINGEFLNSYWSDGLIISTPTGSTGYSLSCGGPIIFPESGSFAISPIAPHNLNVRPIIVADTNIISFEVDGRSNSFLASLDSRSVSFQKNIQLAIKKADFHFNLLRLNNDHFLQTLRNKLMWGLDNRN